MGNEASSIPGSATGGGGISHSGTPQDLVPYTGAKVENRIVLVKSKLKAGFHGSSHSDVNDYMQTLAQQYNEFFKLDTFFRVPYQQEIKGFTSVMLTYQAVFSRPLVYVPSSESWQLQVVPTVLSFSTHWNGTLFRHGTDNRVDSSMAGIYQILAQNANVGGRLVCLECNGESGRERYLSQKFGLNLFFSIPRHPNPVIYTNLAYSTPMHITYNWGAIDIQIDINGTLAMHLNQGWKLVDVIIPQHESGASSQQRDNHHGNQHSNFHNRPRVMNTIWFFEKEFNRYSANDLTPLYQVTVLDIYSKVQHGFGSSNVNCNLAPLLTEMGHKGWILVSVLDTPKIQSEGFTGATNFLKAFFQRPLHGGPPPGAPYHGAPPPGVPPPAYYGAPPPGAPPGAPYGASAPGAPPPVAPGWSVG